LPLWVKGLKSGISRADKEIVQYKRVVLGMKISGRGGIPPVACGSYQRASKVLEDKQREAGDKLELSPKARALKELASQAADPLVREDRVAEIRQRLAEGTYEIPARELARKLLAEMSSPRGENG